MSGSGGRSHMASNTMLLWLVDGSLNDALIIVADCRVLSRNPEREGPNSISLLRQYLLLLRRHRPYNHSVSSLPAKVPKSAQSHLCTPLELW
jgi:hypothetical protein